jgi:hypothetical protein
VPAALLTQRRKLLLLLPSVTGMLVVRCEIVVFAAPFAWLFIPAMVRVVVREAMQVPADVIGVWSAMRLAMSAALVLGACAHFFFAVKSVALLPEWSWFFPSASEVLLFILMSRVGATCSFVVFVISFFFLVMHLFLSFNSEKIRPGCIALAHRNFIYGMVGRMFLEVGRCA